MIQRGDIRWFRFDRPDKLRPVLVVGRPDLLASASQIPVIPACQTALGEQIRGEGVVGLTRAFFCAGARSVVASLWSVSDASTARLMTRFYVHLRAGRSKAEALRAAQVEMIHGGRLARPAAATERSACPPAALAVSPTTSRPTPTRSTGPPSRSTATSAAGARDRGRTFAKPARRPAGTHT